MFCHVLTITTNWYKHSFLYSPPSAIYVRVDKNIAYYVYYVCMVAHFSNCANVE